MYDVIICGAGPAGLTAAIYAGRRNLKTLVISENVGGQITLALDVQNYPGIEKTSGIELTGTMKKQAQHFGVEFKAGKIIQMTLKGKIKKIKTDIGEYSAKAVIIATGAMHRQLNAPGEDKFIGKGVSYCATCDGPLFQGKTVAVVGGSDSAVTTAVYLSSICSKVYLIHRRNEFRAESENVKNLKSKKNVEILTDCEIIEFAGKAMLDNINVKNSKTNEARELPVDGAFIEIGWVPSTAIAKAAGVNLSGEGHVIVSQGQETNIPGVYAAGDVTGRLAQVSVAVGEGAVAATNAYYYIAKPAYKTPDYH